MRLQRSFFSFLSTLAISLWLLVCAVQAEPAAVLTAPARLLSGGTGSATVVAFDAKTREPLNRFMTLELIDSGGSATPLFFGFTSLQGQARANFDVPRLAPGTYTLRARLEGGVELTLAVSLTSTPALLIETDKPIYRPSQRIQGRVVRLGNDLLPQPGPVEVVFLDGKGLRIARYQMEADQYGVVAFSLQLASEVNEGVWRIRAVSEGVESVRDVRVERYTLPRFDLGLDFERDWALVSESISGNVSARYFFGKDVQGTVRLSASRWVGIWEEYASLEATLQSGSWDFQLPPVGFVTGTPQNGGQGAVRIDVEVTDSTGHTQSITDSLVISSSSTVFAIQPTARNIKPGIPFPVRIEAASPSGEPVDSEVELWARFSTSGDVSVGAAEARGRTTNGTLLWSLDPPAGTAYADLGASWGDASTTVRIPGSFSPSGSFLSLVRTDGSGPVAIGQRLEFQVFSTHRGTSYYEVFGGGRTVFSAFSETDTFSFPVTIDMAPAAKVVAYRFNPNNEVMADNWVFEVQIPLEATLSAGFDAEQVRPGEEVEIRIDTGLPGPSLLGLSVVDESVLALGRSRLHLAGVFEELERRFLQPVAEVHEDDGEFGFIGIPFAAPIPLQGAEDVFGESGLVVATTPNLSLPRGHDIRGDVPINLSPPPAEGGDSAATAPEMPRLRQYFPETWVWNPQLLTDEQGKATLKVEAPDSITGWRLTAVATHPQPSGGRPGISFGDANLTVFQDFFVEPFVPYSVVRGERFSLRIDLFNYLDQAQRIRLDLTEAEGLELLDESASRDLTLAPDSASSVLFAVRPSQVGVFPLQVTALGDRGSDAVLRQLRVEPEGFPVDEIQNAVLQAGETVEFSVEPPPDAVPDSTRASLSLTPSPVAQTMQGVADLLEMPYGCGEQNMIFLAPDIEILKYLREIGELSPEIRIEAENFVNTGYQRQLTFQTNDGGFSAFGEPPASLWLTAFVLSTFSGAREVRDIDETVLSRAAALLLSRQNQDGSFQPDRFLIHTEMDGGVENIFALTAYTANALADYGGAEVAASLQQAAGFLAFARTDPGVWNHAYSLAIAAVALQKIQGFDGVAEQILDRLLELAIREGGLIHWKPYPVETTGYATMALLEANDGLGRPEAVEALDWLSTQRNALGGYGTSTQDTVVALRALFSAARRVHRDLNVRIEVLSDGEVLLDRVVDETNFDLLHRVDIPVDGSPVVLRSTGQGSVGYQLAVRYHLPGRLLPPPRDLRFEVLYDTGHVEVDEIIDVHVLLAYEGHKDRTGMVLADVAIPTGFESVRSSLDRLVAEEVVQRVEVAGRKHIFYIEGLDRFEELTFDFQIRALYPVRAEAGISKAYEYYDSSVNAFHLSEPVVVVDPERILPEIDSISVDSAPAGSTVVIRGSGFLQGGVEVSFNGVAASDVQVVDDTTLLVTVPNVLPGDAEISVVTSAGQVLLPAGPGGFQVGPQRWYYPLYPNRTGDFNGFAIANLSGRRAQIQATAYGAGAPLPGLSRNPATLEVDPGRQLARLDSQLLAGPGEQVTLPGWVEMVGDNSEVASLFQFGGGAALDGAPPFRGTAGEFWLTRIYQGPGAYRGRAASTRVTLANPNDAPATVRLRLYAGVESQLEAEAVRVLEGRDFFIEEVSSLFARQAVTPPAHVHVQVIEGPGVVGFARIDSLGRETVVGLTGTIGSASASFWSAQFATAPGQLFSNLKLINTAASPRQTELLLIGDSGGLELARATLIVPAAGVLEGDMVDLLSLGPGAGPLAGSLRIVADGPGLLGDVLFGDPVRFQNAALLPLQSEPARELVFGHQGDTQVFFTGLALHNAAEQPAQVTIRVYSPDGGLLGEARIELPARGRLSQEIRQLVPQTQGTIGGYIVVESTQPLVAQELFGDRRLEKLSAVPPAW